MNRQLCYRICFALMAAVFSISAMFAGSDITFPAKFKRVADLSELKEDGFYLIGGINSKDKAYLLSGLASKDRKFRKAYPINAFKQVLNVEGEMNSCIWKIEAASRNGMVYLSNYSDGNYLNTSSSSATSLVAESQRKTAWSVEEAGNSMFRLKSDAESGRGIGVYYTGSGGTRFGNYIASDSPALYIYKLVTEAAEIPGEATIPDDNATVAIYAGGKFAGSDIPSPIDSKGFLLSDSKVAYDQSLAIFKCKHNSDIQFSLRMDNGKYLGYDLTPTEAEAFWKISDGRIVTCGENPRSLVLTGDSFKLAGSGEMQDNASLPVFMTVGSEPTLTVRGDGIICLEGAWSARKLMDLDWENALGLDLTRISLPINSSKFDRYSPNSNALIYVNKADEAYVPESWPLAVSCSSDGNHLIHENNVLNDGVPFYTDRKVGVSKGQLSYKRKAYADGYWETLCIPFDADIPAFFIAESLQEESAYTYYFEHAERIKNNLPIIIRYIGDGLGKTETVEFAVESNECEISPEVPSASVFIGTYNNLKVGSSSEGLFFLNGEGDTFVLADAGSSIKPFRAYLKDHNYTGKVKRVNHSTIDFIETVGLTPNIGNCYDVSGRRLHGNNSSVSFGQLPKGMYIINGKKIIK